MSRSLKIAQVCRVGWPHVGGMETVVRGLSEALHGLGHEVVVFTLDESPDGKQRYGDDEYRGVRYRRLPRMGPWRYPRARGLVQAVAGFDVVHVHGIDGLADQVVRGRSEHGARVAVSTHGGFFHTARQQWIKALWLRTVTRHTLRRADAVWYTSEQDRELLAPAVREGIHIPNGVDVAGFSEVVRAPVTGRWLVPGRVESHKGIEDLLVALAASPSLSRVALEIVGPTRDESMRRHLTNQVEALGLQNQVAIRGEVSPEDYRECFARCELAFFPSRYEGFGVAVVEAMAAGVPVVTSGIPAFAELVEDGHSGYILDFRAEDCAQRLEGLLGAEQQAMSQRAREASMRHSWEHRGEMFEQAMKALLEHP